MSLFTEHPRARWIAPAAALALAAGASIVASQASADPSLPPRTAEQLLVDLQESEPTPMSGTVVLSANLGLPQVPGLSGGTGGPGREGSTEFGALLSGSHTLRVWYDGPERARIALVGVGGESDLIRNGRDLWLWSSDAQEAVHYTLPEAPANAEEDRAPEFAPPGQGRVPMTPERAAERVLDLLDPTTAVITDGTATVAGRSAYELVLEPRADDTLVRDVRIAVDAERGFPLRVRVHSTRTEVPAFEVGFTDIDLEAPEARMFEFTAPPGTEVTEGADAGREMGRHGHGEHEAAPDLPGPRGGSAEPTVVGSGWESVVVVDVPHTAGDRSGGRPEDQPENQPGDQPLAGVLASLPRVSGDWGSGHLLTGTLFSAVLSDDGRLAIGAVPPEALYAALSRS